MSSLMRTDSKIPIWLKWVLGLLPFILIIALWMWGSHYLRYMETNFPDVEVASSKLMPLPSEMWDGFMRTIEPDNHGDRRLVLDTVASFQRFGIGLGIVSLGIFLGLYMGAFPIWEALFHSIFVCVEKVPPAMIGCILAIVFGIGEDSKTVLVVLGVGPGVVLEAYTRTKEIAREQKYKAQTLGASESQIAWLILFPQILPKMIGCLRSNFKAAWTYVVLAETISAFYGIGFRVYLLKRNQSMDVIIPYLVYATLLLFLLDYAFQWLEKRCPGEEGGK